MELVSETRGSTRNGIVSRVEQTSQHKGSGEVGASIKPILEKIFANGHGNNRAEIKVLSNEENQVSQVQECMKIAPQVTNCNAPVPKPRQKSLKRPTVLPTSLPSPKPRNLAKPIPSPRPDLAKRKRIRKEIPRFNWSHILSRLRYLKVTFTFLALASSLIWNEYRNDSFQNLKASEKATAAEFHSLAVPQILEIISAPGMKSYQLMHGERDMLQIIRYRRAIANQAKFVTKRIWHNLSTLDRGLDTNLRSLKKPVMEVLNISTATSINPKVISHWLHEKTRYASEKASQRLESSLKLGSNWEKILTCPSPIDVSNSNKSINFYERREFKQIIEEREEMLSKFKIDVPSETGKDVITVLGINSVILIIKFAFN